MTQALVRGCVALLLASTVALLQGCSSGSGSTSTGGARASGGVKGEGGALTGGSLAATGGNPTPSGGSAALSGGSLGFSGGQPATGGLPSSGGATGNSTGGQPATGGQPGSGGATETPTGGSVASGGLPGFGGATETPTGGGTVTGGTAEGGTSGGGRGGSRGGGTIAGGVTSAGGVSRGGGSTTSLGGVTATGGGAPTGGNTIVPPPTTGHYQMENLDRGTVAVVVSGGVYVGWRMFGYEYTGTASDVSYNLYKGGTKLANVTDSTNYLDAAGTSSSSYTVSAVIKGVEGAQSAAVTPWAQQYISIPLTPPTGSTYSPSDGATGDLDGDGKLDIVLKWDPSDSHDNAQSGNTSDVYVDGYTLAGKRLWRIDLGPNIRAGAHYTQMSVGDFDGDGKSEFAVKTAPGTKDGTGAYLSNGPAASDDDSAVYRNATGYILTGPEYVTVFAGDTGKELATVDYPVPRGSVSAWGDAYGNRVDRFNGGMAFVKEGGVATGLPSIIQNRGYYTRTTVSSLTFRNGVLAKNWVYDSVSSFQYGGGTHSAMAADVDGDLGQEILTGPLTIDSGGTLKCDSGYGHGDAMDASILVPGKGIAVFQIHESLGGMDCHDGATCKAYFLITNPGTDANRGRAEYVGAGDETSASCSGPGQVLCATGASGGPGAGSNFVMYWDADEWRELENANSISKASGGTLLTCAQCSGNNSTKNTPTLTADLLGDWREEVVWRETAGTALRVYTTTDVTKRRIYTLMHDPTYRAQVNFENSAYNQPPHVGFQISPNMPDPPVPNIHVK